jgi:3-oxoacyl-[acyl-carrier-protein] synthase III
MDRRNTIIESLGVYLPAQAVSTREILAGCADRRWLSDERAARLEGLIGIRSRRMAGDDEASIDLASKAIAKCLAVSAYRPSDVDLLICCSISRYVEPNRYAFEPSTSSRLTARFGFDRALAFDVANGCAGMFTAIKIAHSLMEARLIDVAMVVSGEHITDLTKTAQKEITGRPLSDPRFACLTLGDSGAAVILRAAPSARAGFSAIDLYTAASYNAYSIAKPTDRAHGGLIMFTNSVKLFEAAIRHATTHAAGLLRTRGELEQYQPDRVVIHQAGETAVYEVSRQMNELAGREMFHEGNMVVNVAERGNTATTSHFVAVWDGILSGKMRSGDDVLFAIQGSGLTVGTALYTFDDLPDRVRRADADRVTAWPPPRRGGRARATFRIDRPRIRIESLGIASDANGPDAGIRLAHAAIDRCLAGSSYGKDDVGLLIHTGVYRDEFVGEPAIAAIIAGRANLNEAGISPGGKRTFAFDIFNGAMGFLNGCCVGAGMIQAGDYRTVMVVASEIENNARVPGAALLGIAEAGSAVILDRSPDDTVGFGNAVFTSFGEYAGAFSSWVVNEDGKPRLYADRRADLEDVYLTCIASTVEEFLREQTLGMEDIAVILPPRISGGFGSRLAAALHVESDRVIDLGEDGRDLSSSTMAYTFLSARHRRRGRAAEIALIISVGSGVQVGAALYHL